MLFFRDPRGDFAWWSYGRANREMDRLEGAPDDPDEAPRELLGIYRDATRAEARTAGILLRDLSPARTRDIWISGRRFTVAAERVLAIAALLGGWVTIREPGPAVSAATFLWARPTLCSGSPEELVELVATLRARAPRRRAERWLGRRLTRLRTVWIEGPEASSQVPRVRADLRALGSTALVLGFPGGEGHEVPTQEAR